MDEQKKVVIIEFTNASYERIKKIIERAEEHRKKTAEKYRIKNDVQAQGARLKDICMRDLTPYPNLNYPAHRHLRREEENKSKEL